MPNTEFYKGTDSEGSSGPIIPRNVQSDDCYPHSTNVAGKDVLANGLHPFQAFGSQAAADGRGVLQKCGVLITYNATILRGVFNVAPGSIYRQYVLNTLTYNGGVDATWDATFDIGQPVYVDDSAAANITAGVTLTLSPNNDAGLVNPHAGWLWYDQTEDESAGVGGANADAWPKTASNAGPIYSKLNVMLK